MKTTTKPTVLKPLSRTFRRFWAWSLHIFYELTHPWSYSTLIADFEQLDFDALRELHRHTLQLHKKRYIVQLDISIGETYVQCLSADFLSELIQSTTPEEQLILLLDAEKILQP